MSGIEEKGISILGPLNNYLFTAKFRFQVDSGRDNLSDTYFFNSVFEEIQSDPNTSEKILNENNQFICCKR